ncbi:putative Ig domain-containing protein, partial [Candidatus Bathyarchaeota archaeon]|nr:putative Ig domain-containing protein [Candidatus Bathyarchaeota archaeon]
QIYLNNVVFQTVQGNITSYYVSGLSPGTQYAFNVTAGDSTGLWTPNALSTSVTTPIINQSPILIVPGQQTVRRGTSLTFTVNATDLDTPPENVALSASGLPTGASFPAAFGNPAVSTFAWSVGNNQAMGNYTINFSATDSGLPTARTTRAVTILVTAGFLPPSLTVPSGSQSISTGTPLDFAVVAQDANLPPLPVTLSAAGLPAGATFNPATGVFMWTPAANQAGVYAVIFTADDGHGGMDAKKVSIIVASSSLGTAPLTGIQDRGFLWPFVITLGILVVLVPWTLFQIRTDRRRRSIGHPDGSQGQTQIKGLQRT